MRYCPLSPADQQARSDKLNALYKQWLESDAGRESLFAAVVEFCNDLGEQYVSGNKGCRSRSDDLSSVAIDKALESLTKQRSNRKPLKSVASFIAKCGLRAMDNYKREDTLIVVPARRQQEAEQEGNPLTVPPVESLTGVDAGPVRHKSEKPREDLMEEILSLCNTEAERQYVLKTAELEGGNASGNISDAMRAEKVNLPRSTVRDVRKALAARMLPYIDFLNSQGA